jgi:hypothetical protein
MTDKQKTTRAVQNLSDLGPYIIEVRLELGDDVLVLPMRTLTHKVWNKLGRDISNPPRTPNELDFTTTDKEGMHPMYFNPYHPDFQKASGEAEDRRAYSRLLEAFETVPADYEWKNVEGRRGPIAIDGETRSARIDTLADTLDMVICMQLLNVLMVAGEATVASRARSFQ